jgi:hypothetical protein
MSSATKHKEIEQDGATKHKAKQEPCKPNISMKLDRKVSQGDTKDGSFGKQDGRNRSVKLRCT